MKLLFSTINHTKYPSILLQNIQQNSDSSFTNIPSQSNHLDQQRIRGQNPIESLGNNTDFNNINIFRQSASPFITSTTTPFSNEVRYNMFGRIISANSSGCQSCSSQR